MKPRDLALAALNRAENSPGHPERYLEQAFQQDPSLTQRDRSLTVYLVQGVLRWRLRLDWIIHRSVRFPFKNITPPVLNILRIAVCQILFMDRIPDSAAVNEAVKQAKASKAPHVVSSVNGILRDICRKKNEGSFPDRGKDPVRFLSVFYSYPEWLVKKWMRELGMDSAERLLEAENHLPTLVVRTNRLKINRPDLIRYLTQEGIEARPTPYSPEGTEIRGLGGPIQEMEAFRRGLFQVQGEAAQICSHLISPKPGESILDLCAGLGGKSTHMAELMGNEGRIVALDKNHGRLVKLARSSRRLGITSVEPIVGNAGDSLRNIFRRSFDKILMDGPCSNLGTISRHPDAKWTRDEADIKRLAILQKAILNGSPALLQTGGCLLYVTCTISKDENEGVVNDFLKNNREMTLENLKDHIPEWGIELIDEKGFFRTFPHIHKMDGFFGALFKKT